MLTPSECRLRPAVLADNAFIRRVFAASLPRYQPLMPGSFEANLANIDILTARGLDFNATGLDGWIVVGEKDAGLAGVGLLNPRQAYLAALYLLPEYQRQGLGGAALDLLENHYARRGCSEMLMLVHARADWAQAFYAGRGYRIVGTRDTEIVAYAGEHMIHLYEPELWLLARPLAAAPDPPAAG